MIKIFVFFNTLLFSVWAFFFAKAPQPSPEIPMCAPVRVAGLPSKPSNSSVVTQLVTGNPVVFETDTAKAYSMPLLTQTPNGDLLLSWTEKDDQGVTALCAAFSKDKGKTFSDKKTIYAGAGVGSSRLFRAKVLTKKNGDLVAVFSNRPDAQPIAAGSQPQGGRGRGGRSSELVYCASKDGGNTWSAPQPVDTDPTKGILRGFFDAIVLPNDEVAVVYLKDVKGSTKHEERDLRMALTKNGVFQPEKLLDAVVCDCCNINLLVDSQDALHVYYRDNNDDIRDIARLTSTDNGETFSQSQIIHDDAWKIQGCPHSGAASVPHGKSALVAWFSGAEAEPGVRLVTQDGKKLFTLDDPSVKNQALAAGAKASALLWEQNQPGSEASQLVFRVINGTKVSDNRAIDGSEDATNAAGLIVGDQLILAHEIKRVRKKNGLKIATFAL